MAIHIVKTSMDSLSGHTTMHVRVVERDQATGKLSYGPVVIEGIDHQSLTSRYGCPLTATPDDVDQAVQRWLADRHAVLLQQKWALERRGAAISKMTGRIIAFDETGKPVVAGAGAGGS